jgi:hypothetical protein
MQITTEYDAKPFRFLAEDAKGFPSMLPPVRKIGLCRRSLSGLMASATKNKAAPRFESKLERDFLVLLEYDNAVVGWVPQPCFVPRHPCDPGHGPGFVPDVLHECVHQESDESTAAVLTEIKYRDQIKKDWGTLRWKFRACHRFAKFNDVCFQIITEREIHTPRLHNAKFLLPYRARTTYPMDRDRLLVCARKQRLTSPNTLLDALCRTKNERLHLLPSLWQLVANQELRWDDTVLLTMNTPLSASADHE